MEALHAALKRRSSTALPLLFRRFITIPPLFPLFYRDSRCSAVLPPRFRRSSIALPPLYANLLPLVHGGFSAGDLAAGDCGFAGDEVVAFGLGVGFDGCEVGACGRELAGFDFDFGQRETRVEFDALITQLS